jgi:uncharacterized protein (DUF4415 family)
MKKSTTTPRKLNLKITPELRKQYEAAKREHPNIDPPILSPEAWANAVIGKYYRPIKTAVSVRIDNDVIAWLKSKGDGHLTRINSILRKQMEHELSR